MQSAVAENRFAYVSLDIKEPGGQIKIGRLFKEEAFIHNRFTSLFLLLLFENKVTLCSNITSNINCLQLWTLLQHIINNISIHSCYSVYTSDSQRGACAPLGGNSIIIGGNRKNIVSIFFLFHHMWVKITNLYEKIVITT